MPCPPDPALQVAHASHVGRVRERNEDAYMALQVAAGGGQPPIPFGLYLVADGVGGGQQGSQASMIASRIVAQSVLQEIYAPLLGAETMAPKEPVLEVMARAVHKANMAIYESEPAHQSATTLTAAVVLGRRLSLVHVGDSRAYLLAAGRLQPLTRDHTYVGRLVETGQLTVEQALVHPQRNILYRALGQGQPLEVDSFSRSLPPSGKLLLCSDGLWGLVPDSVIQQTLNAEKPLASIVEELLNLALEAGGDDNITAILVDFCFPSHNPPNGQSQPNNIPTDY